MAQHILVVDDDPQIRRLICAYLERDGFRTSNAADGEQALHLLRSERPDLAVLDVMMPKRDGYELLALIRNDAQLANTAVLMVTARVDDVDRMRGLELGADDYVIKPFHPPEIVARARAILRRAAGALKPSPMLAIGPLTMNLEMRQVLRDGERVDLTPSEFELLRLLLQHPGQTFTRAELAEKALGFDFDGFERTIDTHIKNLRRKVEPEPAKPAYIETVFGVGYRLSDTIKS